MYKCYIIDDDLHAVKLLETYAIDSGQLEIVGSTQNPLEAIKYINENKNVDITFLDIEMSQLSGLEVADLICKNTAVIFTTGHCSYAVEGFEKEVFDFLLKPISFARFLKSFYKVSGKLEKKYAESSGKLYFFVNPGRKGQLLKIDYDDVKYIEGLSNYILIHTYQESHTVYLKMGELEEGLLANVFIRIHKSFIINLDKVTMLEGNKIMINDVCLPIGSSYKQLLINRISNNLIKTNRIN